MGLLQNVSILNAEPLRYLPGGNAIQCANRFSYVRSDIRNNCMIGSGSFSQKSGVPNGYTTPYAWIIPIKDGGMSSYYAVTGVGNSTGILRSISTLKTTYLQVTGTLNPDVTGRYTDMGILMNSYPVYQRGNDSWYIFYNQVSSSWVIANQISDYPTQSWSGSNITSTQSYSSSSGGVTGTATVTPYMRGVTGSGDIDVSSRITNLIYLLGNGLLAPSGSGTVSSASMVGGIKIAANLAGEGDVNGAVTFLLNLSSSLSGEGIIDQPVLNKILSCVANLGGSGDISNGTLFLVSALVATVLGNGDIEAEVLKIKTLVSSISGDGYIDENTLCSILVRIFADISGEGTLNGSTMKGWADMGANLSSTGEVVTAQSCAEAVWDELLSKHNITGSVGDIVYQILTNVELIKNMESGRWKIENNQMIFYDSSGEEIRRYDLLDEFGNPSSTSVFERVPVS